MGSEETTDLALSHQIIFHPPNNNTTINPQRLCYYQPSVETIFNSALPNSDGDDDDDEDDVDEKDGNLNKFHRLSPFGHDVKPTSIHNHYPNSEFYHSHHLHRIKDTAAGFSGRKDESGDSLRSILSDPLTGALMDDAMILPCGHSFGTGGIQHAMKMKTCYTCSHHVTEGSVAPNLSLRSAVLAFRKEEESQVHHESKRRRERLDQDRINYNDLMDTPRGKGLQFPFSVADRVIIKGNKRTPERFFGCEAVVTTQCLNGWYVVKTLDTAESIKLQYRSLAKVSDSSSQPSSSKMAPNWL